MSQEKKYDVFISYSRKDSTIADEICKAFDRVDITYFIDRQGIGGGNEFPLELATSILNSQIFLLLGSKNSYESKYTNAEIHFAFKKKQQKSILPYILDDTPMPLEIDFILSTINRRKYQEHPINTILVDDVLKLLGRERPTELVRKDANIEQAKREALPAGEFQVGELMYKASENSNGVTVCGLINKGTTEIDIPSQIQYGNYTYDVDCIGFEAFDKCSRLTAIIIPNSVTSIRMCAFKGCSSLISITIPNSVTNIESYAFSSCSGLASITVERGNKTYDSRENCNAIIETASNTLIAGCKNTIISNSVTSIGYYAFDGCSGLTSITIPNSVTSIGNYAFKGCSSLTSIVVPDSVTSIRRGAFVGTGIYNNESNWQNGVLYIDNCLIAASEQLSSVYAIRSKTRLIADGAFYDCSSLTSIVIPNGVTSIGLYAFKGCYSLTSITIPNSVTSIDDFVFEYCFSLLSINYQGTIDQWKDVIAKSPNWKYRSHIGEIFCTKGLFYKRRLPL